MTRISLNEAAARLTVIERAIVSLAVLVEELRQDCIDSGMMTVVELPDD